MASMPSAPSPSLGRTSFRPFPRLRGDRVLSAWLVPRSRRRSAARRRDKASTTPPAVFYLPFPPFLLHLLLISGTSHATQRPGPYPAARPRRPTSWRLQRPPPPPTTHLSAQAFPQTHSSSETLVGLTGYAMKRSAFNLTGHALIG